MDDLISRSDFLTVHVPLLDATKHLVNAERLKLMRKGGVVLNFARGGIVDEEAVLASLDAGHLGAERLRVQHELQAYLRSVSAGSRGWSQTPQTDQGIFCLLHRREKVGSLSTVRCAHLRGDAGRERGQLPSGDFR